MNLLEQVAEWVTANMTSPEEVVICNPNTARRIEKYAGEYLRRHPEFRPPSYHGKTLADLENMDVWPCFGMPTTIVLRTMCDPTVIFDPQAAFAIPDGQVVLAVIEGPNPKGIGYFDVYRVVKRMELS